MRQVQRFCLLLLVGLATTSCSLLYYGYLPGGRYKYLRPRKKVELSGRCVALKVVDHRAQRRAIDCSAIQLDRETELEGKKGVTLFEEYAKFIIEQAGGRITSSCPDVLTISIEGLSFSLIGVGYIVPHGLVQFRSSLDGREQSYCTDMTDRDEDSPIGQYSLRTRRNASRMIVSGALRRTLEEMVSDLSQQ